MRKKGEVIGRRKGGRRGIFFYLSKGNLEGERESNKKEKYFLKKRRDRRRSRVEPGAYMYVLIGMVWLGTYMRSCYIRGC